MNIKRTFATLMSGLLLLSCNTMTAFAEVALPDGAVKGLPEKLTAMDSDGNAVSSDTGEYFFHVEDMEFGEVYTKDVQLMNLRDDAAYHIYFYVEPLEHSGDIDLATGCTCTFYLDGEQVYQGDVNGHGTIDLTEEVLDTGLYEPGDSHKLSCAVSWNKGADYNYNNGHRLVDANGTTYIVFPDDKKEVYGEVTFKWIFYAAVDEDYVPPKTGLLAADGSLLLICMGVLLVLICGLLVLLAAKKKKEKKE